MSDASRREQALALMGLHVAAPGRAPHGDRPDDEELGLLVEGRVDPARRQQILSHVAADALLYNQLVTLSEMHGPTPDPRPTEAGPSLFGIAAQWLRDWRIAMATGALATAALAVVVVTLPALQPGSGVPTEPARVTAEPGREQPTLAAREESSVLPGALNEAIRCTPLAADDANRSGTQACVLTVNRVATNDAGPVREHLWFALGPGAIGRSSGHRWLQQRSAESYRALRASGDGAWLALHAHGPDGGTLRVLSVAELAQGRFRPVATLALGTAGLESFSWRDGYLEFLSRRDFASAGDRPVDLETPRRQRLDPATGEIESES